MPKTTGVVSEPKWEHDGKDMSTAPKLPNPNPSGEWDWGKIKHQHSWIFDDRRAVEGLHCNRVRAGCTARRDGPICVERVHNDNWGSNRCTNTARVHDEKPPSWGADHPESASHAIVDSVKGWWYCGVHNPERQRIRDRAYRIKSAERDARWDQRDAENAARAELLREVASWRHDEAEVGDICDDLACEHHACKLFRTATAYEALIAEGERMREEEQ